VQFYAPFVLAAAVGATCVAVGVAWRLIAPRVTDRARGETLAARAMRDGACAGFAALGVGTALLGFQYLGAVGRLTETAGATTAPPGPGRLLVAVGLALPTELLGGLFLGAGVVFVFGALAAPTVAELRNAGFR
jgi:hypothetical protein